MSGSITTSPRPAPDADRIEEIHYSLEPEDYVDLMRLAARHHPAAAWTELWKHSCFLIVGLGLVAGDLIDSTLLLPYGIGSPRGIGSRLLPILFAAYFLKAIVLDVLQIMGRMPLRYYRSQVEAIYQAGLYKRGRRFHVWMTADEFVEQTELYQDDGDGTVVEERIVSRARWSAVECIDGSEEHICFKIAEKGYLVVPKRIFLDEAAVGRYLKTAQTLRAAYLCRMETPFLGTKTDESGLRGDR